MISNLRKFLWRVLGFDYQILLDKTNYTLLKQDIFAKMGVSSYDNGAKVWRWTNEAELTIGNYCSIAHDVNFILDPGYHCESAITSYPLKQRIPNTLKKTKQEKTGITIGHDVWIGMGAFILPGVTIGNGVTVAANAVVTKNIPDYTLVAGSPAQVVRKKFDDNIIKKLNDIAWWHWKPELIKSRLEEFYLFNIEEFIKKYG